MSNIIENSGKSYDLEINEMLEVKTEIEYLLNQCCDDLEAGDSNYIAKLAETNEQVTKYYSHGFSEFLEEMGVLFSDYSEQFKELDELIKTRL